MFYKSLNKKHPEKHIINAWLTTAINGLLYCLTYNNAIHFLGIKMPDFKNIYNQAEHISAGEGKGFVGEFSILGGKKFPFNTFQRKTKHDEILTGWKTHLSVDAADISKATAIICDVYSSMDACAFKVARPEVATELSNPALGQAGKMFTLYDMGENNWQEILQEIETKFNEAGIKTSHKIKNDRPIKGSKYAYYRNDGNFAEDKKISAQELDKYPEEQRHNPYKLLDPFKDIKLNVSQEIAQYDWIFANSPRHGGAVMRIDASMMNHSQQMEIGDNLLREKIKFKLVRSETNRITYIQVSSSTDPEPFKKLLQIIHDNKEKKPHPVAAKIKAAPRIKKHNP